MPLDDEPEIPFFEVHEIVVPHLGHVPIVKGDFTGLPKKIQQFIAFYVSSCGRQCHHSGSTVCVLWVLGPFGGDLFCFVGGNGGNVRAFVHI